MAAMLGISQFGSVGLLFLFKATQQQDRITRIVDTQSLRGLLLLTSIVTTASRQQYTSLRQGQLRLGTHRYSHQQAKPISTASSHPAKEVLRDSKHALTPPSATHATNRFRYS